jgi:hypothetical protein
MSLACCRESRRAFAPGEARSHLKRFLGVEVGGEFELQWRLGGTKRIVIAGHALDIVAHLDVSTQLVDGSFQVSVVFAQFVMMHCYWLSGNDTLLDSKKHKDIRQGNCKRRRFVSDVTSSGGVENR